MANIIERRDGSGRLISYQIRVYRGRNKDGKQLKPYSTTFEVESTWSEKTARKKAEAAAALFEDQCKSGRVSDNRQTFEEYCDYVIELKEQRGVKHNTILSYKQFAQRIYPVIGHMKLKDIRVDTLNLLYSELQKDGQNKNTGGKLSAKTIFEHHRLISTVLQQAVREQLIQFNPASYATLPKREKKEVNYYQPETVSAILDALESEPLKWKTFINMLLFTGARKGEVLGLKWQCVDFKKNAIHICNNLQYSPERGVYEESTKTSTSDRFVQLPPEIMNILAEYKLWQLREKNRLQDFFVDRDYVFTQDNGDPIHPQSVKTFLDRFSARHNLPHLNAHAFRHTNATVLYNAGMDSVSISKQLGHAQVSTTADIYAHAVEGSDRKCAEALERIFLKNA